MHSLLQVTHVLANIGASDASMRLGIHEVAQSDNHFLDLGGQLTGWGQHECLAATHIRVDGLQNSNREGCSLASTWRMRNEIVLEKMAASESPTKNVC